MGLRETNAARTREAILDVAIDLFTENGFDATTLEDVAERAGVAISTLYRYFPTKDLLVLTPAALNGQMSEELARRPDDESMEAALGHAVLAVLRTPRGDATRLRRVSELIASSPALRSSLREEFVKERMLVQEAIASRTGRAGSDPYCAMTARIAVAMFELAAIEARGDDGALDDRTFTTAATTVMSSLRETPPTLPYLD